MNHARISQHWACVCLGCHLLLHFLHVKFFFACFCLHVASHVSTILFVQFVLIISWSAAMSGLRFTRQLSCCIEVFSVFRHWRYSTTMWVPLHVLADMDLTCMYRGLCFRLSVVPLVVWAMLSYRSGLCGIHSISN